MKDLILIGAGAFGREILNWLPNCIGYNKDFCFKGFIDNQMDRLAPYKMDDEIIALIKDYVPQENDYFLCTVADLNYRRKYVKLIEEKGGKFITIIHKTCEVSIRSDMGKGIFVAPFSTISCGTVIGNHVLFNSYGAIGHDVTIEDFCHIGSFILLGGRSIIKTGTTIHPQSVILPSVKVGKNVVVGAGSIVIKSVKPNQTVFGAPAKKIL